MTNDQLWQAIINLAKWLNLSCSGLATKLAGLDATTFNKSKRINRFGEKRWPTTCSLAKVLMLLDLALRNSRKNLCQRTSGNFTRHILYMADHHVVVLRYCR